VLDGFEGGIVAVCRGEVEEFAGIGDAGAQFGEGAHHFFEGFLFTAQVLGVFGVVPDRGVFQFRVDDLQAFRLGVVVKDTPEAPARAAGSRPGGWRSGSVVLLPCWIFLVFSRPLLRPFLWFSRCETQHFSAGGGPQYLTVGFRPLKIKRTGRQGSPSFT
jgi:hypothetical protein